MKRFKEWFVLKERLDKKDHKPPMVSAGEIWWASLGENVGHEIQGKGHKFSRPVIILKKLSRKLYFVIPVSTQIHEGEWYVPYTLNGLSAVACLHHARVIDYRRLYDQLDTMNLDAFSRVQEGFRTLYI